MTALYDEEENMRRHINNVIKTEVDAAVNAAVNAAVDTAVSDTRKANSEDIARNLLSDGGLSIEKIAACTGLSVSEVEALAVLQPA